MRAGMREKGAREKEARREIRCKRCGLQQGPGGEESSCAGGL